MYPARRAPDLFPNLAPSQLGRMRREALDALEREARERQLRGQALRTWFYRLRAMAGNDMALEVALRLADREPA